MITAPIELHTKLMLNEREMAAVIQKMMSLLARLMLRLVDSMVDKLSLTLLIGGGL